jgi:hypothetical protein
MPGGFRCPVSGSVTPAAGFSSCKSGMLLTVRTANRYEQLASHVLQSYYTRALFARAALLLAVRHPRLYLCGSSGVWRYAPLRCKTPENTIIVI